VSYSQILILLPASAVMAKFPIPSHAGATFGQIVPLHGKPLLEALFTEGALAPAKAGAGRGAGTAGRVHIRGGLRNGGQYTRRRGVGPVHTLKIQHGTDCGEVELTVSVDNTAQMI
jgi:hypothetical protein